MDSYRKEKREPSVAKLTNLLTLVISLKSPRKVKVSAPVSRKIGGGGGGFSIVIFPKLQFDYPYN